MAEFRVAAPAQLDDVLSVLNEAAAWLHTRGETWLVLVSRYELRLEAD